MENTTLELLLAQILKVPEVEIQEALALTDQYQEGKIPKRRGGWRKIYLPPKPLKRIQHLILRRLFYRLLLKKPSTIYGLCRKVGNYSDHVFCHQDSRWIFQFDLSDAFPSVDVSKLRQWLCEQLCAEINRMIDGLNRLMGCDPSKSFFWNTTLSQNLKEKASPYVDLESEKMAKEIVGALSDLVIKLTTFRSILPQGTPTAPFLFYLALLKSGLFSEIKAICPEFPKKQDKYYFRISAYVDGFVVSAKRPVPERNQALILRAVERAGFKVNPKKIRHQDVRHGNVLITGLRLTEKRPNIKIRKWPDLPFLPLRRVPVFPKRKIARWRGLIHRAIFQPDLRPKAQGIVAAVRSVYGTFLPPQIRKPYQLLLSRIKEEKQNARP